MELTAATPDLQKRNVELLQLIERATNGNEDVGTPAAQLIVEKKALQAELRRRGDPIKAEARSSTAQSKAVAQQISNAQASELLQENAALRAELAGLKKSG